MSEELSAVLCLASLLSVGFVCGRVAYLLGFSRGFSRGFNEGWDERTRCCRHCYDKEEGGAQ